MAAAEAPFGLDEKVEAVRVVHIWRDIRLELRARREEAGMPFIVGTRQDEVSRDSRRLCREAPSFLPEQRPNHVLEISHLKLELGIRLLSPTSMAPMSHDIRGRRD
jgi:hypothetical protein